MNLWEDIQHGWKNGDQLIRLIAINVIVFFGIQVFLFISEWTGSTAPLKWGEDLFMASSSDISVLVKRPWSVITHMFAHIQFQHFLFNVIFLYSAGRLLKHFIGSVKIVYVYVFGGLSGFIVYFLFYNLFPSMNEHTMILGASASAMAIVIAVATISPKFKVKLLGIFDLELMWLAVILVFFDLWYLRQGENTGGHIGHLGGALFGFVYARSYMQGKPIGQRIEKWLSRNSIIHRVPKEETVKPSNHRYFNDDEFNTQKVNRQQRVDQILDKISRSGYDSLSKEEKEFLFKNSQK